MVKIIPRSAWGGPSSISTAFNEPMKGMTAHNTYIPAAPRVISEAEERAIVLGIHREHRKKWAGIGYHFLGFQSGRVYEGRGWRRIGAHAGTATGNRTLGFAFVIDGHTTEPSDAALDAFWGIQALGFSAGHLSHDNVFFHDDWKSTLCPGPHIKRALMMARNRVILRRGDRGPRIERLHDLLVATGYMTQAEVNTGYGTFGPRTEAAFGSFLAAHTT